MPNLAPKVLEDLNTWPEDVRERVLSCSGVEAQLEYYKRLAPEIHRQQGEEYRKRVGITPSRRVQL